MAMLTQIEALIDEEVQRRIDARLNPMLEHISKLYDISYRQLLMDVQLMGEPLTTGCQGIAKKGRKCRNNAKQNGFCHLHQSQVPKKPERRTEKHTHTLPPFFLKGCPVCEPPLKSLADCFDNE